MTAQFPEAIYEGRERANLPGILYSEPGKDPDEKIVYAEDLEAYDDEINAIETTLGENPQGDYETVREWLDDLSEGGGGSPGGDDTQVQFNNEGAFGGSPDFTYDDETKEFVFDNLDISRDNADVNIKVKDAKVWETEEDNPNGRNFSIIGSNGSHGFDEESQTTFYGDGGGFYFQAGGDELGLYSGGTFELRGAGQNNGGGGFNMNGGQVGFAIGNGGGFSMQGGGGGNYGGDGGNIQLAAGAAFYGKGGDLTLMPGNTQDAGLIDSVEINNPGTGYHINDIRGIAGGSTIAHIKIENVDETGAITEISLYDRGTGYTTANNVAVTGSSGGATVDIVSTVFDRGYVKFVDPTSYYETKIINEDLSDNRIMTFPDASGTVALESGASGTFTTVDNKTVTVVNGIITEIAT
jgi:hypothetical protein